MKRYKLPLPGNGTSLPINLFLFSLDAQLKVWGGSLRRLYGDNSELKAWAERMRNAKRAGRPFAEIPPGLKEAIWSQLADMPNGSPSYVFGKKFLAAIASPEDEDFPFGPCEVFYRGFEAGSGEKLGASDYIIAIERASHVALKLFNQGEFDAMLPHISSSSLLKSFLWPDAESALKAVTKFVRSAPCKELPVPQRKALYAPVCCSIALEAQLSILAAKDVEWSSRMANRSESLFVELLPQEESNPTSRLFHWLKKATGRKSIRDFLDDPRFMALTAKDQLNDSTIKRWSSGKHHPGNTLLNALSEALSLQSSGICPLLIRNHAARTLLFLGYIAQFFADKCQKYPNEELLLPWPRLPHGHPEFASWCQTRYPYWFDYHQRHRALPAQP